MQSNTMGHKNMGLELTAEEAQRLLTLCLTSPARLDAVGEAALKKLALYCRDHDRAVHNPSENSYMVS